MMSDNQLTGVKGFVVEVVVFEVEVSVADSLLI